MIFRVYFIVFVLCITFTGLFSQETSDINTIPKIEWYGYSGALVPHRKDMRYLSKHPYIGNEIRLSLQTTGAKNWHKLHNYPSYGVGYFLGTYNNEVLGSPMAFFAFMEFPFARKEKGYLLTSWSIGASFNFNEYNPISNPDNIAIGGDLNLYSDFSFIYRYKMSDRLELGSGIKLQHFSNGAVTFPNLGLNMASVTVALSYFPSQTIKEFEFSAGNPSYNTYEITGMLASGIRAKSSVENNIKYLCSTASLSINKRYKYSRAVGVGVDYFYQGYLVDYYAEDKNISNSDLMNLAAFLSSELIAGKIRGAVQLGFYFHRKVDFGRAFYERLAVRYYVSKIFFFNLSIKAHVGKAEFFEWGLGMSF